MLAPDASDCSYQWRVFRDTVGYTAHSSSTECTESYLIKQFWFKQNNKSNVLGYLLGVYIYIYIYAIQCRCRNTGEHLSEIGRDKCF